MEGGAFRGLRVALGMSFEEPPMDADANKKRTDSASSGASSHRSSRSSSHRRRHRHERDKDEPIAPRDSEMEPPNDEDGERSRDEMREEVICAIFDLPRTTTFFKDYSCAIAAAFPMHGRMYPTSTHVCFYSNVFGRERKILIPYESITELTKTTTLVFQGAIRLKTTTNEDYTFSSFWGNNRDKCFELIGKIRNRVLGLPEESIGEADSTATPEVQSRANEQASPPASAPLPKEQRLRTVSDGGVVAVPRDTTMELLVEEQFPLSVGQFLATFIEDDASFGLVQYHARIGTTEMMCNPWSERSGDESLGRTRVLQFRVPIDSPIGPNSSMVDVLQCHKIDERGFHAIETSTRLVDIPYGDYFSVEDRWTIAPHRRDPNLCTLTIELKVVFTRSTFWKGQIESRAIGDNKTKWLQWVNMAKDHLANKEGDDVRESSPQVSRPPSPSTSNGTPAPSPPASSTPASNGTPAPSPPVSRTASPPTSNGTPVLSCQEKGAYTRRPSGVVVEPRAVDSVRDRSRASPRTKKPRRRVLAQVFPWIIILILVWIIYRLNRTLTRMEFVLLSTEMRLVEIQKQIAELHTGRGVCR